MSRRVKLLDRLEYEMTWLQKRWQVLLRRKMRVMYAKKVK